jgi:prepilin-type N-terminal cleavage/methylation domain-containing protein
MESAVTAKFDFFRAPEMWGAHRTKGRKSNDRGRVALSKNNHASALHPLTIGFRFRSQAFTLIELLVATAVVSVFIVLAVELATFTLRRAEQSNARLRSNTQARLVMDWITRDLQTAFVRKDGGEWIRMENQELTVGSLALPMARLMLFSQAGESHNPVVDGSLTTYDTGPAAVLYEADYCDPITLQDNKWNTTALFRVAVEPRETFELCFAEQTPQNLAVDFWDSLPGIVGQRESQHVLIQNIVGFQIKFEFTTDGTTILQSTVGTTFSAGVDGNVRDGSTTYSGARVLSAEITLWLLEPEGVRALQREAEGAGMTTGDFFNRYARSFVRKIPFQSQ